MQSKIDTKWLFVITVLIIGIFFIIPAGVWGVEPKDGDVISSSNIEQYKDYFPSFMQRYIKDGWGVYAPVVIHVTEKELLLETKAFREATAQNKGKCSVTSEGLLEGYSGQGRPFTDMKEPNLAFKIMWNQYYKELADNWAVPETFASITQRKGGPVTSRTGIYDALKFSGRTGLKPIPELPNPKQLRQASILNSKTPPNIGMATLTWRYKDVEKHDDMWTYIPALRRTLRLVSSERANPIRGTCTTWDGIFGFDGKIPQFTYKYLGEQKVLSLLNVQKSAHELPGRKVEHPVVAGEGEPWEVTSCYVIEIKSKNPRYPEARRVTWIAKNNFKVRFAEVYDKANKLWKGFYNGSQTRMMKMSNGPDEPYAIQAIGCNTDIKTFYWTMSYVGHMLLNSGADPNLFGPQALGTFY